MIRLFLVFTYSVFLMVLPLSGQMDLGGSYFMEERNRTESGFELTLDNGTQSPLSVYVTGSGFNYRSEPALPAFVYVPPGTTGQVLKVVQEDPAAQWDFNYQKTVYLGNCETRPDTRAVYTMPYAPGTAFYIIQGYFGEFSHSEYPYAYAIDFVMPEGTPIHAARGGRVLAIKEDSDRGGPTIRYIEDGNRIWIEHPDGSLAVYYHLEQNGALVEPGDSVARGELIGRSGNTGFSTLPHLHFMVMAYRDGLDMPVSVNTNFYTGSFFTRFIKPRTSPWRMEHELLLDEVYQLSEDWFWSAAIGTFHRTWSDYIYHVDFGWLYVIDGRSDGIWLHGIDNSWYYTSATFYPYLYAYDREQWEWKANGAGPALNP